jgi:hypothetical protein
MLFIELNIGAAYCRVGEKKGVIGHSGMYSLTEQTQLSDGNLIQIAVLFQSMSTEEESST